MAFETPTLNDFVRISENGLSTAFYGESSVLRKSVLKVLARVFAGVAFLVVLLLKKMWKNVFWVLVNPANSWMSSIISTSMVW